MVLEQRGNLKKQQQHIYNNTLIQLNNTETNVSTMYRGLPSRSGMQYNRYQCILGPGR